MDISILATVLYDGVPLYARPFLLEKEKILNKNLENECGIEDEAPFKSMRVNLPSHGIINKRQIIK